jgi:hypothetical protein
MENSGTNSSTSLQSLINTNKNLIDNISSNTNITPQNVTAKVNFLYKQVLIVLQQFVTTFLGFMNDSINMTQEHEQKLLSQDRKFVTLVKQIDEYDKKVTNVTQLMKEALLGVEENDKKVTEFTTLMNKVLAERQTNTPMSEETRNSMYSGGNKTRKQRKYKRKISK